jgi:hypothetical protein
MGVVVGACRAGDTALEKTSNFEGQLRRTGTQITPLPSGSFFIASRAGSYMILWVAGKF